MKFIQTLMERGEVGRHPDTSPGIAALFTLIVWLVTEVEAYFDLWQE